MLYGATNHPVRPVLEELEGIAGLGFDYMELAMDPPQAHYKVIHEQREDLLKALARLQMGLICHLPTFVSTADLTDGLREASVVEVLESLKVAAALKAMKVVLHPGSIRGMGVLVMDQSRRYALRSLEIIAEKADQLGLDVCLENMFPQTHSLLAPEDFVEVFKRFPKLRLTLDTGHAHMSDKGGNTALDFIKDFQDRIGHIHANDNFGREDIHLPIGAGTVDFPQIIRALKGIGYNETITLEVFSRDRDYLKLSREKLAQMFDTL
jgi:sugar phosphate isomerase/epimerase